MVSVYANGTPMAAVVCPTGFVLSIFSTGIRRFWHFSWIVDDEPLVNQILCSRTLLHDIWPVCTTLSKTMSHLSLVWPGCVKKLKLVPSGLDAGKFLIVQFLSICSCDGAMSPAKPSITPFG